MSLHIDGVVSHFSTSNLFDKLVFSKLVQDTSLDVSLNILNHYQLTLNDCIQDIDQGMMSGDNELIWKSLHKVSGSAELLGFQKFGVSTRRLSKSLQANTDLLQYKEQIDTAKQEMLEIKDLIFKYFSVDKVN